MSNKRKHQHIVTDELDNLLKTVTPSSSQAELFEIITRMQALIPTVKPRKIENKPQTIAASSIENINEVVHLTGIKYLYGSEAHSWSLLDDPNKVTEIPYACPWLEALCRTPIHMILFDRLSLKQDIDGARKLVLKGERTIRTACLDKIREITGIADYVMGYGYAPGIEGHANLESTFIVIQFKKEEAFAEGKAQMAVYLAGIQQQRRLANKIVFHVYGVVTNGITFQFLRLDHDLFLQASKPYEMSDASDRKKIYRYLDSILDAAISCSPHTTPSYLEECSDDDCEETWAVVRSDSPNRSNMVLLPSKIEGNLTEPDQ